MKHTSYLSGPAYMSIIKGFAFVAVMWVWASVMEMDMELETGNREASQRGWPVGPPLSASGLSPYAASDSIPDPALRVQAAQTNNERKRNQDEKQGKFAGR